MSGHPAPAVLTDCHDSGGCSVFAVALDRKDIVMSPTIVLVHGAFAEGVPVLEAAAPMRAAA